jgi:hypothetical protein
MQVTIEPADESPSQQIVKAANQTVTVTDALGRQITFRKQMRASRRVLLAKAAGAQNVENKMYMGDAAIAFLVTAINGEAESTPINERQLDALIGRLDDEGLSAVAEKLLAIYKEENPDEDVESLLKNASGTPS